MKSNKCAHCDKDLSLVSNPITGSSLRVSYCGVVCFYSHSSNRNGSIVDCPVCGKAHYVNSRRIEQNKICCSYKCSTVSTARKKFTPLPCKCCGAILKQGEGYYGTKKQQTGYCPRCYLKQKKKRLLKKINSLKERSATLSKKKIAMFVNTRLCPFCMGEKPVKRVLSNCYHCGKKSCKHKYMNSRVRKSHKLIIEGRMKVAINKALRGNKGGRQWESLVGYSLSDLINHLESLFTDGMSWDNMGMWHIDHIIPKSKFNYSSVKHPDFKRCWGLDNLQPLWAKDNLSKHDRLEDPFQPLLKL